MAQNNIIMAFRKRLKKRGYRDISIRFKGSGLYVISAIEPLSEERVRVERGVVFMSHAFR